LSGKLIGGHRGLKACRLHGGLCRWIWSWQHHLAGGLCCWWGIGYRWRIPKCLTCPLRLRGREPQVLLVGIDFHQGFVARRGRAECYLCIGWHYIRCRGDARMGGTIPTTGRSCSWSPLVHGSWRTDGTRSGWQHIARVIRLGSTRLQSARRRRRDAIGRRKRVAQRRRVTLAPTEQTSGHCAADIPHRQIPFLPLEQHPGNF